jgi:rare lipoprotein A
MSSREFVAASALAIFCIANSNCAKKHVPAAPNASLPRIQNGETGLASWYGHPYHGRAAADGEIYDMEQLTAAHRTLPFNTRVRVTNLENRKTVEVRIIDRGPFVDGRVIDLSHAAAREIDLLGPGVARVRLDIISLPEARAAALYGVQAGAFRDRDNAERLRASMEKAFGSARVIRFPGDTPLWRVVVGREQTIEAANRLAGRMRSESGGEMFVVRIDDTSGI